MSLLSRVSQRASNRRTSTRRPVKKRAIPAKKVDHYVSDRIRSRRQELGLTQQALARHLKISYQQVQKYETGLNRVSAGRLFALSQALNVNIDYFYEGIRAG